MHDLAARARIVAVTGPQRSGTTITARIIADMLGWRFIDETDFGTYDNERFRVMLVSEYEAVVQCPTMFMMLMRDCPDDVAVVLVRRALDEIHVSQRRIGWREEWEPLALQRLGLSEGDSAETKYRLWDEGPRPSSAHEVQYGASWMRAHRLWCDRREGWANKQTEPCD